MISSASGFSLSHRAMSAMLLCTVAAGAVGSPITLRFHYASAAVGVGTGGSVQPGRTPRAQPEVDFRFLDVAVGPRLGGGFSVMPWLVVAENMPFYYYTDEPYSYTTSLGVIAVWRSSRDSFRGVCELAAGFRGCDGWGIIWPGNRFVDATVSAGSRFWFLSPSVDVGWRRELPLHGLEPPAGILRDRFWLVLRVGMGGVFGL